MYGRSKREDQQALGLTTDGSLRSTTVGMNDSVRLTTVGMNDISINRRTRRHSFDDLSNSNGRQTFRQSPFPVHQTTDHNHPNFRSSSASTTAGHLVLLTEMPMPMSRYSSAATREDSIRIGTGGVQKYSPSSSNYSVVSNNTNKNQHESPFPSTKIAAINNSLSSEYRPTTVPTKAACPQPQDQHQHHEQQQEVSPKQKLKQYLLKVVTGFKRGINHSNRLMAHQIRQQNVVLQDVNRDTQNIKKALRPDAQYRRRLSRRRSTTLDNRFGDCWMKREAVTPSIASSSYTMEVLCRPQIKVSEASSSHESEPDSLGFLKPDHRADNPVKYLTRGQKDRWDMVRERIVMKNILGSGMN